MFLESPEVFFFNNESDTWKAINCDRIRSVDNNDSNEGAGR